MNNEYLLKTGHLVLCTVAQCARKKLSIVDYYKSVINVGLSVTIKYTENTPQTFKSSNLTIWTFWRQNMATIEP